MSAMSNLELTALTAPAKEGAIGCYQKHNSSIYLHFKDRFYYVYLKNNATVVASELKRVLERPLCIVAEMGYDTRGPLPQPLVSFKPWTVRIYDTRSDSIQTLILSDMQHNLFYSATSDVKAR